MSICNIWIRGLEFIFQNQQTVMHTNDMNYIKHFHLISLHNSHHHINLWHPHFSFWHYEKNKFWYISHIALLHKKGDFNEVLCLQGQKREGRRHVFDTVWWELYCYFYTPYDMQPCKVTGKTCVRCLPCGQVTVTHKWTW